MYKEVKINICNIAKRRFITVKPCVELFSGFCVKCTGLMGMLFTVHQRDPLVASVMRQDSANATGRHWMRLDAIEPHCT